MKKETKFSPLFYNAVTYLGAVISLLFFLAECFLFAIDHFSHGSDLYLGLLTYLILPPFLILGLILIPAGALWKRSRVKKGQTALQPKPFHIDLSVATHRNAVFVFITGTFFVVVMTLVGAYKGFHYTESVKFCGVLCHQVMHPEFTAYSNSPHARVKCVECHIGAGADWYVRSKASGARQVLKTLINTYERPIKTPVHNLRPAEETCKECHSPGKFFGTMDFKRTYFLTSGDQPRWYIRMLMNVGGGDHQSYGVHAHMNLDREIYYVADDEKRQKISWVKSVDKDGTERVFTSPGSKYAKEPPPVKLIRKMDCIDCHNRPTHQFIAPYRLVNEAIQYGNIDADIPRIKEKAVEVLSKEYKTASEAAEEIPRALNGFYKKAYPDFYAAHAQSVERAIECLVRLFKNNMFPEMKVRWDTHPDNIGHLVTPGCYRCHDGEHRSAAGGVITRNCKACHLIVEQGPAGNVEKNIDGLEFRHPPGGEEWKEMNCADCHTGGA